MKFNLSSYICIAVYDTGALDGSSIHHSSERLRSAKNEHESLCSFMRYRVKLLGKKRKTH